MGSKKEERELVMARLADPHQLEAVLLQLTAPDTQQIAQAEGIIKKYAKSPACIPGFMQQVSKTGCSTSVAS